MENIDNLIIGAGVVGLSIARAMAMVGHEVVVIEGEASFGQQTSSRNSSVIHAGIHYAQGSLKARLCVRGNEMLYDFCHTHKIDHQRVGKITVAHSDDDMAQLAKIKTNAEHCGVMDLVFLSPAEINNMEPELSAVGGLFAPSSGIVDNHGLMLALLGEAEEHGAGFAFKTPFLGAEVANDGFIVRVGGAAPSEIFTKRLINCAGLFAGDVAHKIKGLDKANIPQIYYAKGNYFTISGKPPFKHLIYPLPNSGGLGIHYTLDHSGRGRFGPDVEWVKDIDYNVNMARQEAFVEQILKYYPALNRAKLSPDFAGVRPKLDPQGRFVDFQISDEKAHGVRGLINLFGIDSPGLTSSMAIGEYVVENCIR